MESFFVPDGDGFIASELTRGPWDPEMQHGGPPAALLGTVLEQRHPRPEARVVRFTVEIFRPVPWRAPLTIATRAVRPGKRVELLEATLDAGGERVMHATAWRVRTDAAGPTVAPPSAPLPPPDAAHTVAFFPTGQAVGYHTGMEARFLHGGFVELGPAAAWTRMRHPLLPDQAPTPLARVLIAADSGNGISGMLDYRRWVFVNTDLTVYLHRLPIGEWVALDAFTALSTGVGVAESTIHDLGGPIGKGLQSLFVAPRP
jgi:hypothetical protein